MAARLQQLLADWRAAERAWEDAVAAGEATPASRAAVLETWWEYNVAAGTFAADELVLVADSGKQYVAAFRTQEMLGFKREEVVGRQIIDLTPAGDTALMEAHWQRFLNSGSDVGQYPLLRADGSTVLTEYQARAHHPIPGLHVSRHRAAQGGA